VTPIDSAAIRIALGGFAIVPATRSRGSQCMERISVFVGPTNWADSMPVQTDFLPMRGECGGSLGVVGPEIQRAWLPSPIR